MLRLYSVVKMWNKTALAVNAHLASRRPYSPEEVREEKARYQSWVGNLNFNCLTENIICTAIITQDEYNNSPPHRLVATSQQWLNGPVLIRFRITYSYAGQSTPACRKRRAFARSPHASSGIETMFRWLWMCSSVSVSHSVFSIIVQTGPVSREIIFSFGVPV